MMRNEDKDDSGPVTVYSHHITSQYFTKKTEQMTYKTYKVTVHSISPIHASEKSDIKVGLYNTFLHQKSQPYSYMKPYDLSRNATKY